MGVLVLDLNGPFLGLGLAFRPGLGAHNAGAVLRHIHAALKGVPLIGGPLEGDALFHSLMVGADFKNLLVADQRDEVTLVDHTNVALDAAVTVGHHIGLDGVIAGGGIAEDRNRALEKHTVQRLSKHLVAIQITHLPLEARPVQARGGKAYFTPSEG